MPTLYSLGRLLAAMMWRLRAPLDGGVSGILEMEKERIKIGPWVEFGIK